MLSKNLAGSCINFRAQSKIVRWLITAQIKVAVPQADLFARLIIKLERQWRTAIEHFQFGNVDLNLARGQVLILGTFWTCLNNARDLNAVFRAQMVSLLCNISLTENNLCNTGRIAKVNKNNSTVITATGNPARESNSLSNSSGVQFASKMRAQHENPFMLKVINKP